MRYIIDIDNPGSQERDYGPTVARATITIEDTRLKPEYLRQFAVNAFRRMVVDVPESPTDWYVYSWDYVEQPEDNTFRIQASRPWND